MAPDDIRNQVTKMTYKVNALCWFTASSKDHKVPDSKQDSGCVLHEQLSSERKKQKNKKNPSMYFWSRSSFNVFHEASVVTEKVLERFSCYQLEFFLMACNIPSMPGKEQRSHVPTAHYAVRVGEEQATQSFRATAPADSAQYPRLEESSLTRKQCCFVSTWASPPFPEYRCQCGFDLL